MRKVCDYVSLIPLLGKSDSNSYQKLSELATKGPNLEKPPDSLSTNLSDSAHEAAATEGTTSREDIFSFSESPRSSADQVVVVAPTSDRAEDELESANPNEGTSFGNTGRLSRSSSQATNATQATTADDNDLSDEVCCNSGITGGAQLSINKRDAAGQHWALSSRNKTDKSKSKSVRYLFYEFISPQVDQDGPNSFYEEEQFDITE